MTYYLLLINLFGFLSMGVDKRRAIKNQWRIRERTLFLIAAMGGSIGSLLGMQVFRHKTKHKSFVIGIPCIIIAQIVITCIFMYFYDINILKR